VPLRLSLPGFLLFFSFAGIVAFAQKKPPAPPNKAAAAATALPSSAPVPKTAASESDLWVLRPVVRPEVATGVTGTENPIDAFIRADYKAKGLQPVGPADKRTLLRRVYLDLIGIPPTPAEQDEFVRDQSPQAYEKIVDKLLASDQYGVRYARHWLDVLRYADVDERMIAAPGIYLWRDWMIRAINGDMPYDQFTRAQLTGYRTTERTQMTNTGYRQKVEPRPEDVFALGFLARGDVIRDGKEVLELPITAVETVSTTFMGLTVGCAKCHDHMYDPIKQKDFYAMKALFDPLVLRKLTLGTPDQIFAAGKAQQEADAVRAPVQAKIDALTGPIRDKLYQDRLAMLPPDTQAVIRKPEKERTPAEQKIADDYFPVLRIDADKIQEVMTAEDAKQYKALQQELARSGGGGGRRGGGQAAIPTFWTVEADPKKELDPSYILTSGDPERPEKNHEVKPGWPFAPQNIDFREGRIEAFSDWLTAKDNPMFARVAVNRLWEWNFGEGLQKSPSDFGKLGGTPSNPKLLDWLASEFVNRGFSMKQMTRLMVTSDTYKLASDADPKATSASAKADPTDTYLWHYRLQRLEAEPVWDSILYAASDLDTSLGGPSFDPAPAGGGRGGGAGGGQGGARAGAANRRAAYMVRGFTPSRDVMPHFLQAFDVDDGRLPCPVRTQTVTAPQGLFMMNSNEIEKESAKFAERVTKESGGDIGAALDLAYQIALSRPPSPSEKDKALTYLANDPSRLKDLAWLLFNLDEFIYVK
jgi:hypothetical protein